MFPITILAMLALHPSKFVEASFFASVDPPSSFRLLPVPTLPPYPGDIKIDGSVIINNIGGSWYPKYAQISQHEDTPIKVTNSTIQERP